MKVMKRMIPLLMSIATLPALAHGPTPQKTDQTVLLDASPKSVWQALSTPCEIANWHPQVADCKADGQLKRTLTLKNGAKLMEEIDEILSDEMSISYRLGSGSEESALPVSSLTGRIKVKAEGEKANVVWIARYYRADTTNEPPKGKDDASAQLAVNSYVREGLLGLEEMLTKK